MRAVPAPSPAVDDLLDALAQARARIATLEALLREQATRDPLTGLPNQVQFGAQLDEAR